MKTINHIALACFFTLALGLSTLMVRADNGTALKEIQEAMQAAIQEAEPAIACILVSRSEDYIKLGETPPPDGSGRLGIFDLDRATEKAAKLGLDDGDGREMKKLDMTSPNYVPESYGSGVVIDDKGLILTNEHVIREATKIYVRLPGGKGSYADVHAADPRSDLAVLRLLEPVPRSKAIKLGDAGKVRKGQFVISLANPFAAGFRDGSPSASWGIISNIRRRPAGPNVEMERIKSLTHYGILLQTDARINLGCSGGALIDLKGELIGLSTALAAISGSDTAGGFGLPMDAGMKRIVEVLKKGEEVEYGFLGVGIEKRPVGLAISSVSPYSPADHKGLRVNDVILSVNGVPIVETDDLFVAIGTSLAGGEARLEFARPGVPGQRTLTVSLAKFTVLGKFIASRRPAPIRGLRVDYLSVMLQNLMPMAYPRGVTHGVIVRDVIPGSPAAAALLKPNDIITHVKGDPIHTPADFYQKTQGLAGPLELTISNTYNVKIN